MWVKWWVEGSRSSEFGWYRATGVVCKVEHDGLDVGWVGRKGTVTHMAWVDNVG